MKKIICDTKLTMKKCLDALNSIGTNKSPGNDGLSKESYNVLFFLNKIQKYLVEAPSKSFQMDNFVALKDKL